MHRMHRAHIYNVLPVQDEVREYAGAFGKEHIAPLSQKLDKQPPRFPVELYRKMADAGFLGFTTSPEWGGKGKTWLEYATLIETLSTFDASVAFILSIGNLAITPIELFGTDEQKHRYLTPMIKGESIGAFALTEPGAGSDAMSLRTTALIQDEALIVNGEKVFISSGDVADIIILICTTHQKGEDAQLSALIVEADQLEGLTRDILKDKMGLRGSTTARLQFQGSRVPRQNLIGEVGQGFKIAMKSLDYSRVVIAAQAVGLGQACLNRAVDFSKKREAFGGPIAKLASIQEMLAEMSTHLEAARLLTYKAATLMDKGEPFGKESAQAKLFASDMVNFVADRAVQIHGGYGYVGDFSDIEKLYRDARVIPIYEGTSEIQKMIIARHIVK